MPSLSRRQFVAASSAGLAVPAVGLTAVATPAAAAMLARIDGGLSESFPAQDPDDVQSVVGKSHTQFDAVKEMVTKRPELAKAAWDWGFGDWESALGAASHMGRRDIAELLIEHGARPDLFTFAMFGQVDVVRSTCEANPGIQRIPGPHGISLLQHARRGGDDAADVVEYLERLGDADIAQSGVPLEAGAEKVYLGEYDPAGAPDAVFRIGFHERRKVVTFQRDERQFRMLVYQGDHVFNAGGSRSVTITFDVRDGRAVGLAVRDGGLEIKARRRT